ncbi:MAG TPA: DUF418 domain-containing protein [Cellvibrionaceae bacterium]|nr:DUF418 domain-containing protein [Cellvibrionaceae bacterium]
MQQSRIDVLDALRGYALMGLFLIHMVEYYEIYWLNPIPHPLNDALFMVFGGKAFAIFAFLFGVSFYILLGNQQARGVDFRGRFIWRLSLLLAMGYVHSLLYGGDILQVLALCGLCLVPLWRAPHFLVLCLSVFFLLQGPLWLECVALKLFPTAAAAPLNEPDAVLKVYAEGSFAQLIITNAVLGNERKWAFMLESGRLWTVLGMSLLGFLLARLRVFSNYAERARQFTIALFICVLAGALFFWVQLYIKEHNSGLGNLGAIASAYFNLAVTLGSVCLFVLLYLSPLQKVLRYLAAPGRMTLSIYLAQSLVCVPIFYGFGLAAWAFLGQVNSFLLGLWSGCGARRRLCAGIFRLG